MLNRSSQIPPIVSIRVRSTLYLALGLVLAGTAAADSWQSGVDALKAKDLSTAERHFQQVTVERPDWYGGYRMLGQTHIRSKRFADALAPLKTALELAPDDSAVRYDLGLAALSARDFSLALSSLQGERPASVPDSLWHSWLHLRAKAARETGDLKAARSDLEALLPHRPKDAKLHYMLADLAHRLDDRPAAFDLLKKAASLEPTEPFYLAKQLAWTLSARNEGAARQAACVDLSPAARNLARLAPTAKHLKLAARLERCAGDTAAEVALLTQAIDAGDRESYTLYSLGKGRLTLGQVDEGLVILRQALATDDEKLQKKIHARMGYGYQLQHKFDQAMDHYRQAGDAQRLAQAQEAKAIHLQNLAEEDRYQAELALRQELEQAELELKNIEKNVGGGNL